MKSIDCSVLDSDKPTDVCIDELIDEIGNKCSIHVPLKRPKKPHISKYHRERKILMRRRSKLYKKTIPCPKITKELIEIEAAICSSHHDEKRFDESQAVAKIRDDPEYFFRFAKKSSICKTDIGPLKNVQTNCLTHDKLEMCKLLLDHFDSVFTPLTHQKLSMTPRPSSLNPLHLMPAT